jgi:hypothetical protein
VRGLGWLLALAVIPSACAHTQAGGKGDLHLGCPLPEAEVYVDDFYLGRCALWKKRPLPLKPGFHTIEVRAPGRYPFYGEVEMPAGSERRLDVSLRETLD